MVETKGSTTGFAAEWEEIELVAVGVLAMGADEGGVFFVHFDEGVFGGIGA